MTKEKQETISLPVSIVEKIKKRIDGTGFESVSAYVAYVLEEVLSDLDNNDDLSEEDEEKVKERLRALGYME